MLELHRALKASAPGLQRPALDAHFVICGPIDRLAYQIADECAPEIIISAATPEEIDGAIWYDLDTFGEGHSGFSNPSHTVAEEFADELRYCEARGLLTHHPTRPNLAQ